MDQKLAQHVKFHEGLNMHFLNGNDNTIFENGVLVPSEEFSKARDIKASMRKWSNDPKNSGYDYKRAIKTGEARKINRLYSSKPSFTRENFTLIILSIVTICSVVMSAYHTAQAQINLGKSVFTGWITGVSMILFSGFVFSYIQKIKERHNTGVSFLYAAFGFIIILYSMFSAYLVGFDKYMVLENQQEEIAIKKDIESSRKMHLESQLDSIDENIALLQKNVDYWKDKSWQRRDESFNLVQDAINKREEILMALMNEMKEENVLAAEIETDVFIFLETLFGIKSNWIKFIVQLLPALFYDVMAPLGLIVLMGNRYSGTVKKDQNNRF